MNQAKNNSRFSLRPNAKIEHSAIPKTRGSAKPDSSKQPNPNYIPPASVKKEK